MSDEELDLSWASDQIAKARVPVPVGNALLSLLRVWGEMSFPTEAQQEQALDLFGRLARAEVVVEDDPGAWTPVRPGMMIKIGDTVRVKKDAFTGPAGQMHNGRRGRVVAKRYGDIIIKTTDERTPQLDSAHYPPDMLELKTF